MNTITVKRNSKGQFVTGSRHSEEVKQKIRDKCLINPRTKNSGSFKKGNKLSESHIEKLRKLGRLRVPFMLGKKHSHETRRKMSESRKGRKSHFYKHGKSNEYRKRYNDVEYKIWRESVFERDNYTCQDCGDRGVYITAHHIKSWSKYPDLRFELSNGLTLCEPCHSKTDNYKGRNNKKV